MADKKIGELPKVTDLYSESLIPVEQQGKAMHMTGKQFSDFGKSVVQEYVEGALEAAEQATASQEAAAKSASDAETSANTAKTHADAAKKSEDAASASETNAENSAAAAKESQDAAKQSADTASAGAKVVTDNKAALDAVADNVEAIQNAASNAQKAQESADAAASDAAKAEAAAKNAQAIAQGQKGYFEDPEALRKAVPTGEDGDWAIVGTTDTIWIWDADTGAWTNSGQNIDLSNYYTKTEAQAKLSGAAGQAVGFDADGNAQAVEVGGRNLLLNSGVTKTGGPAQTSWEMAEPGIIDEKYTFSALIEAPEGVEYVDLYRNTGSGDLLLKFPVTPNQKQKVVFTFTNTYNSYAELVRPALIAKPDTLIPLTAYWAKLELGSVATDWSPAPEDIQTELDGKQDKLTLPLSIEQGGTGVNNTAKIEASTNEYFMFSGITSENNPYYDAFRVQMDARTEQPNPPFTFFSRRKSLGTWESQNVYTSSHKPTPADIGAQAKLTGTAGQVVGFDASGAAQAVEVGGVNLYTGTKDFSGSKWISLGGWTKETETYKGFTVISKSSRYGGVYQDINDVKTGDTFTFSFYGKASDTETLTITVMTDDGDFAKIDIGGQKIQLITEWKHYSKSFTVTSADGPLKLKVEKREDDQTTIYICGIKLERGSVATDWTPAPEDLQEKPTDGVLVPVYPNAGAHNSVYRGKNIQDKFDGESLYTAIQNGTFDDLYIGDYFDITISTEFMANEKVRCLLAGFDVFWGCGNIAFTKHHAVIVPMNCFATTAKMNETNDTTGSYVNSKMYTETLPMYADALRDVFDTHLIKNYEYMGTSMDKSVPSMAGIGYVGASNGAVWRDCELRLMSEVEVYGSTVFSSSAWDVGTAKSRLPLFTLAPNHIVCGLGGANYASTTARSTWWLSAIASATNFALVSYDGLATNTGASYALGVRPRWLIG